MDHKKLAAKVRSGEFVSDWLPFFCRAAVVRDWFPPQVGEQAMVFCPNGDPAQGVILAGIYQDKFTPPGNSGTRLVRHFGEGFTVEADLEKQEMTFNVKSVVFNASEFKVQTKTASIENDQGEVIATAAKSLEIIAQSLTTTMLGEMPSKPSVTLLPKEQQKLESFGG